MLIAVSVMCIFQPYVIYRPSKLTAGDFKDDLIALQRTIAR